MSVVKMKKLELWACAADARELSVKLIRQKCVDVSAVPLNEELTSNYDASAEISRAETDVARYAGIIKILTPFSSGSKTRQLTDVRDFIQKGKDAESDKLCDVVLEAVSKREETEKQINALIASKNAAAPWLGLDIPLGCKKTDRCAVLLGSLPMTVTDALLEEKTKELAVAFRRISVSVSSVNMLFICTLNDEKELLRLLAQLGFQKADFPEDTPAASAAVVSYDREIKILRTELNSIQKYLLKCGDSINDVRVMWDMANTRLTEAKLRAKMAATEECVLLRGWVPESNEENIVKMLAKMPVAYDISDPVTDEYPQVPVKLHNNPIASCFEWVISMYSLPAYGSYDPTAVMAFFYIVLFATMMADAGYGILLILGGFIGPYILHSDTGMRRAMNMFGWCGVGCIVTGILFGGYFGNLPVQLFGLSVPALIDPVEDPVKFLIMGIVLGFIHLVAGQFIDFCITWKTSKFDAICDHVFYWIIYAGIIMIVLMPGTAAYAVTITGAALVVLTGGRKEKNWFLKPFKGLLGLYGLVNFGSDLISYARILAIALSGTVLAQVFNILATMSSSPAYMCTAGILILVVGHVLNCVLSALSGFVHTSRLQYVEFFGKFYKDGGKAYAPMLPSEKFSKI